MTVKINKNRERKAILWLKDGESFQEIPEDNWPSRTHGDDATAARRWSELTGLPVTIETLTRTTVKPDAET